MEQKPKSNQEKIEFYDQQIKLCYKEKERADKPERILDLIKMYEEEKQILIKLRETQRLL